MVNEGSPVGSDVVAIARSRVRNGPVSDWVKKSSFAADFKSEDEAQVTYLLFDTQIHAERHEAYIHQAIRLETMQAVQNWSQWRLQFEPKTQLITLHSLKIRRGDAEIDQSNLEKSHLLQREEGLERFVILGWFTLLMVLDDVRPGDILEFSYTIETQPKLFSGLGGYFFILPQTVSVGKYHFGVQFNAARQRRWKTSAADLTPAEIRENGTIFWEWSGEKYAGLKPEINTPSWHVSYLWIQVSDFPDWQTIAVELSKAWTMEAADEAVAEIAREIEGKEPDLTSRIEKAIRLVQDECRYLSVNLELGGQIPTPPGTVAQRRFGDCKDLSFLLTNVLKKLGVEAKPVLVNTFLRKSVGNFLPTPSLFNHVVVEFEADGKRRWIDTTFKEQGGGPFNRIVPDYALGLPVDASATGLVQQPQISGQSDVFDLHEHILLDTNEEPSLMAVTVKAEGNQAELLRQQLRQVGLEEWAKQRLQVILNRFRNAKRIGLLKYHDDRAANRFILTEVFEINFVMGTHPNSRLCRFNLPGNVMAGVLASPQKGERRNPFLLPYPCQINHVVDVDCLAIKRVNLNEPRVALSNPFVQFNRTDKGGHGYFVMKLSLVTRADSVPAEQVQKHGELVEQIARASCRELSLLRGYSRSRPKSSFGELPISNGIVPPLLPSDKLRPETASSPSSGRHRHSHVGRYRIPWRLAWIAFVIIMWIIIAILKNSSH